MATKRRGNGEGSITKRGTGWTARISLGYNSDGKRKRVQVYGKTKREVQGKLSRMQSQRLDGTLSDVSRLTVKEYLEHWLEDSARLRVKKTSYRIYETMIRVHLVHHIGKIAISKINPAVIQGMYAKMETEGVSQGLRKSCHTVLSGAFNQAVRWGLLASNPCKAIQAPRAATKPIQPLTAEQARMLLREAEGDKYEAIYVLALTTGMREGEILALHWENIDFDAGKLSVIHSLMDMRGKLELTTPKTKKSRRLIDLPALAINALLDHKRRMEANGKPDSPWVFCNGAGKALDRGFLVRRCFKPLLNRAGLPGIRFHDLRHTAATLMLAENIHPKVVQERLGHCNIAVTLDIYSHVTPTMQKEASDTMNRVLSPSESHKNSEIGCMVGVNRANSENTDRTLSPQP